MTKALGFQTLNPWPALHGREFNAFAFVFAHKLTTVAPIPSPLNSLPLLVCKTRKSIACWLIKREGEGITWTLKGFYEGGQRGHLLVAVNHVAATVTGLDQLLFLGPARPPG